MCLKYPSGTSPFSMRIDISTLNFPFTGTSARGQVGLLGLAYGSFIRDFTPEVVLEFSAGYEFRVLTRSYMHD
jgi:hypothetical protein